MSKNDYITEEENVHHRNNASSHISAIAIVKITEFQFDLIRLATVFPRHDSSDFLYILGSKLDSNEKTIISVEDYFAEQGVQILFGWLEDQESV